MSQNRKDGASPSGEASPLVVSTSPKSDYGGTKSSETARDAFRSGDVEASRAEHEKRTHIEKHGGAGSEYIKSIVFGGLDGIMTTFAIVTAAAGSDTNYKMVLILGISNVLADAFSMGFGEYVSGSAERDFALEERKREEWEVENAKDLEIKEMIELYEEKGLSTEDATKIVDIISKDNKIFVDFMMVDELQILVDTEDEWEPAKQGLVMFTSFVCFGMLPIFAYLFTGQGHGTDWVFGLACALVAAGLLILGAIRGYLTSMSIPISALTMLFNGCVSGGVSYFMGSVLNHAIEG